MGETMDWQPFATWESIPTDEYGVTQTVLLGFPEGDQEPRMCIAYRDPYYAEGGSGYCGGSSWVIWGSGETVDLHFSFEPVLWAPLPKLPAMRAQSDAA